VAQREFVLSEMSWFLANHQNDRRFSALNCTTYEGEEIAEIPHFSVLVSETARSRSAI
jgi:hypothetical protein